jgi:serine/threonine protein kinase
LQNVIKKVIIKDKLTTEESWAFAKEEFDIHRRVDGHPNIVRLYATRDTDKEFQIFMEHANRSNYLSDKISEVSFPWQSPLFC